MSEQEEGALPAEPGSFKEDPQPGDHRKEADLIRTSLTNDNGKGPFRKNGIVNGTTSAYGKGLFNGRSIINGNGLVNGKGLINGQGDRVGRGLINGKGLVNGKSLVNGDGLVNGREAMIGNYSAHARLGRRRRSRRFIGMAVILAVAILVLPAVFIMTEPRQHAIAIDGLFGDWEDRPAAYETARGAGPAPSISPKTVRFCSFETRLAFYVETWDRVFPGPDKDGLLDSFLLLVDTDRDQETGYSADGIGAERLIEITGWDNRAKSVRLSTFDHTRSRHDWNGWSNDEAGRASANGNAFEGEVPLSLQTYPLIRFFSFGAGGQTCRLEDFLSTGPLVSAVVTPVAPLLAAPGEEVPLARLTVKSTAPANLASLEVGLNTTHLDGVPLELRLRIDDDSGDPTQDDPLLATKNGSTPFLVFSFAEPLPMKADVPIAIRISAVSPDACCTLGVRSVRPFVTELDWPVASQLLPPPAGLEQKASIGIPSRMEVDGTFADWRSLPPRGRSALDPSGDVQGGAEPSLDMVQTSEILDETGLAVMVRVAGTGLAGTVIPFEVRHVPVPAQPGPGPLPGPAPPLEPRIGTDRTEILVSVGGQDGCRFPWLSSPVQYLLAVEGREGRIVSSTLERFTGDDPQVWKGTEVGVIPAAVGGSKLECAIPKALLPDIGDGYSLYFRTTNWNGSRDDLAMPASRPMLQFAMASFDPLEGLPQLPAEYFTDRPNGYFVVQLDRPVTDTFLTGLGDMGATALDLIPTYGIVVHLPSNDTSRLLSMDHVRWVGIHQPAFRIDPELLGHSGLLSLEVSVYRQEAQVALRIERAGGTLKGAPGAVMKVDADSSVLPALAGIPDVKFIERAATAGIHNNIARGITNANLTGTVFGLTGKGQIIAIADSGLDTGNDTDGQPNNTDFYGRVVKWYDVVKETSGNVGGDGNYTDDWNGHGTHVTGTAVGSGNNSNGVLRGVAPEAQIVFQACGDDNGSSSLYIYNDIRTLFQKPYNDGARVHSDSWGYTNANDFGKYLTVCEYTDDFLWNNKSMLVVFSAGNQGTGGSGDSVTVTAPGTAKNVLTVGASESNRPELHSWGDNPSQVAYFSSRGGTTDGRIKPDLVAPGTWILSSRSSLALSAGWGNFNDHYLWMGGTSQAAPHVSGAAILVRQYYTDYENITPSGALMKATLINGADDLGTADIPNMNEGWGRLNLTNCLFPEKPRIMRYVDNNTGFSSGASPLFLNFTVGRSGSPLKFTLVWTDHEGSSIGNQKAAKLVNDLDISVTAPNGTNYLGNVFSSGWSTTGGSADGQNNVECVYLKSPPNGTYKVNITPDTISSGPQPFALVVSGELVPDFNVTNITTAPADAKPGDDILINATVVNCGSENLPVLFKENLTALDPGVAVNISDVAFSPAGDFALLVGANRTVVRYDTSSGCFTTLDTSGLPWTDFEGVSFNPQNSEGDRSLPEALLVGTNGTAVDYNGSGFKTVSGIASADTLLDVAWNSIGTMALMVGNAGKVYTFPNTTNVFSDDFESGDGNWAFLPNSSFTRWNNTTADYKSYNHSMNISIGKSAGGDKDNLTMKDNQTLNASGQRSAWLEFQHKYNTSIKNSGNYDQSYCFVNISADGGGSWHTLAIYFSYLGPIGWRKEVLDIFNYIPSSKLKVRFSAASDPDTPTGSFWRIDDVYINRTEYAAASLTTLNSSAVLRAVRFQPGTNMAVIIGDGGIGWKYSGGALSNLTTSTSKDLRGLAFKPQDDSALIAGANGTVLRYFGGNDTIIAMSFPDSNVSFWDIDYRQDSSLTGPKPDCSQALLVGAGGSAWQFFGYDDHFNNVSIDSDKTFYAVGFNNTRYPLYGPALLVGYGSGPIVRKDVPEQTFRPFLVDFYKDNSSYSTNWLGRVIVEGGLTPDPNPPWDSNKTVSFLWESAPNGSYNITVRIDIGNNETASPPSPDRINEVEEWTNNQLSLGFLLVPEFGSVLLPMLGAIAGFIVFRRAMRPRRRARRKSTITARSLLPVRAF